MIYAILYLPRTSKHTIDAVVISFLRYKTITHRDLMKPIGMMNVYLWEYGLLPHVFKARYEKG